MVYRSKTLSMFTPVCRPDVGSSTAVPRTHSWLDREWTVEQVDGGTHSDCLFAPSAGEGGSLSNGDSMIFSESQIGSTSSLKVDAF